MGLIVVFVGVLLNTITVWGVGAIIVLIGLARWNRQKIKLTTGAPPPSIGHKKRLRKKLQKRYDKRKSIYQNQNVPYNIRQMAGREMQVIAQQAVNEGVQITY